MLPAALLLLFALGGIGAAALTLTRSELIAERGARLYLERRYRTENALFGPGPDPSTEGVRRVDVSLGGGYLLVEASEGASGPSTFAIKWRLEPDSIVAQLPYALEVAEPPPAGVGPLPQCPTPPRGPLVSSPAPAGSSTSQTYPSIGLLGVRELMALADADVPSTGLLSGVAPPAILRALPSVRITGGQATGLLVSPGHLFLEGDAMVVGLVIVAGDLDLRGVAGIEGVAIVGGRIRISDGAEVRGCPARAADALRHPALERDQAIPSGSLLGRY